MITVSNGLKNSFIVLELLRSDEDLFDYDINIGCFTNCRECGLTFMFSGFVDINSKYVTVKPFTWCVYEHRSSDEIIINGQDGYISLNGVLPYQKGDNYSYLGSFRYNQFNECANALKQMIRVYANSFVAEKKQENPT